MSTQQSQSGDAKGRTLTFDLVSSFFAGDGPRSISNFDGTPQQKFRLTALTQGSEVMDADALKGETFAIKYWYAHNVKVNGDSAGEYTDCIRIVLVNPKLEMVGFTSKGLVDSLVNLIDAYGLGPYETPINVKVDAVPLKKGRKTFVLIPVE